MQIPPGFTTIECLSFLAFSPIFLAGVLFFCAQRVPSTRERSHRRVSARSEKKPSENAENGGNLKIKRSNTSQRIQKSQKSQKSQRKDAQDSIKIIRGQKNLRKVKPAKGPKTVGETDSQHTEIINIPLGKAADTSPPPSNLTTASQKKEIERGSDGKKVKFAEVLVKSTVSPAGDQKSQKSSKSAGEKSRKSTKSTRSKRSKS